MTIALQTQLSIAPPNAGPLTMSSLKIADLVGNRHGKVKHLIERLADRDVISLPPMRGGQDTHELGRVRATLVYRLEERDSFVAVAQLSPEFTARLADSWQELEGQIAKAPAIDLSDPVQLRQLLPSYPCGLASVDHRGGRG